MQNILLLVLLMGALYTDLKWGKIYNWLTFPIIIIAILINGIGREGNGLLFSLQGLGVGIAIFVVPFILGWIGGGDVKLVGAIGAIKGTFFVIWVSLIGAIIGGIISLIIMSKQKILMDTLKRFFQGAYNVLFLRLPFDITNNSPQLKKVRFPYATAIVIGALIVLFLEHQNLLIKW